MAHVFTLPVGVDRARPSLTDLERTAARLPAAALESINGGEVTGSVRVKVGPISTTFNGVDQFTERDSERRVMSLRARSRDVRGAGTANATIVAALVPTDADSTRFAVSTDLTGKAAQFGTGVISEVGNTIIEQFVDQLAHTIADQEQASDGRATPYALRSHPRPRPVQRSHSRTLPILTPLVLKRVGPVAAGFVVGILVALVARGLRGTLSIAGLAVPGAPAA